MSLFDDMQVFVRVVDAGSFSRAADLLGVAKSMVSRRVSGLETRLGASLFNRTTRRLSVTEVGQAYYDRARRILDDVAEAEDVARRMRGELVGRVRVAAPLSFAQEHLCVAISDFMAEHPRLEIELDMNDQRVDLVEGGYDLAVRIGVMQDSSLIARLLSPCRRVVCASPVYLQRHGEPHTLDELGSGDFPCIVYGNRPAGEMWRFRDGDGYRVVSITSRRFTANNGMALRDAAVAGLGIVTLPTFIASTPIVSQTLRIILPNERLVDQAIYAVWPPGRQLSTKVRALVEMLSVRFGAFPYWDQAIHAGLPKAEADSAASA